MEKEIIVGGKGGGEGTDNYNDLSNKPKINNVTLNGNKTASDLGLASAEDLEGKIDSPESAGSEGQVLTLDENGDPVWEDPQGGGGGIPVVEKTGGNVELEPNKYNMVTVSGTSMTFTLGTPTAGIVNEYMVEFDTGATPPSVSFPSGVMFPTPLTIEANRRYQISIIDNIVLFVSAQLPTE